MSDQRDDKALVPAELPPVKIARSLQTARNREVLYVDRQGRVRSPARLRAAQAVAYGGMIGLVGAGTAIYYSVLGPVGLVVGAALGAWSANAVVRSFALRTGQRLMLAERFDEAAALFHGVLHGRLVPRRVRATAQHQLARCCVATGRHEEALAHYRGAIVRWGANRGLMPALARRGEILTLVNLGRLPEARAGLTALGPVPEGEYLRILHWTIELYLALAEGQHGFAEDELYRRSREALAITSAAALLGLLAWAYQRSGDAEMSRHLLGECLDRREGTRIATTLPVLQRWLDAQAASA
jgi:hypothetical protein